MVFLISLEGRKGWKVECVDLASFWKMLWYIDATRRCQIAEAIREMILEPSHTAMDAKTELLLTLPAAANAAEQVL